ncbi:hypothetical protein ACIRXL_09920 [Avibacterium paragallinarum]|uniref:hypothetical protein n=1 Tax=Avibacterium paragallinarum TaxID=728 RepID=UPI00397ACD0E
MSILIISSHPNLTQSVANQTILEHLKTLLPTAEFVHLDSQYPDFRIDGAVEQNRLMQAGYHCVAIFVLLVQLPSVAEKMGGRGVCIWLRTRFNGR